MSTSKQSAVNNLETKRAFPESDSNAGVGMHLPFQSASEMPNAGGLIVTGLDSCYDAEMGAAKLIKGSGMVLGVHLETMRAPLVIDRVFAVLDQQVLGDKEPKGVFVAGCVKLQAAVAACYKQNVVYVPDRLLRVAVGAGDLTERPARCFSLMLVAKDDRCVLCEDMKLQYYDSLKQLPAAVQQLCTAAIGDANVKKNLTSYRAQDLQ